MSSNFLKIFIFVFLTLTVVLLRIPTLFEPYWYGDEGVTLTVAQRLFAGDTIYKDVYDNKPPLLYVLFGLMSNLFWVKFLMAIWVVINFILIWFFAQKIADRLGGNKLLYQIGASLLFIYLTITPALEGNIANAEIFMILPIAAGMFFLFESIYKRLDWWMWFLAGFLFAFGSLFKVPAAADFAAAFLFLVFVYIQNRKRDTLKNLTMLASGFLFVWVITFCAFLIWADFSSFLNAVILDNFGYIEPGNNLIVPQGKLIFKILIISSIIFVLFLNRIRLGKEKILLYVWLALSFLGTQLSGRNYTHYLIQAIIPFSLSAMLFLTKLKPFWIIQSLIVALLFIAGSYFSDFQLQRNGQYYQNFISFLAGRKSQLEYQTWFDPRTERLYFLEDYIKNHSNSKDQIFIWGNEPDLYFLTNRIPATPYLTAYHILSVPGAKENTLNILNSNKPKYIVTISNLSEHLPEIETIIENDYRYEIDFKGATIYHLK